MQLHAGTAQHLAGILASHSMTLHSVDAEDILL